jgi:hypothetical protein
MYKKLTIVVIALALTFGFSGSVSAQSVQEGPMNQAPGTGNTGGQTVGTTDDNQGFNWMWLLPLLAIPVVLYMVRKKDNREERTTDRRVHGLAGSKGGRAREEEEIL